MDSEFRRFGKFFAVIAAVFFVIAVILSVVFHQGLVYTLAEVYFWIGLAYVAASTLAWSGVANLYRYSPTLFVGSRSYRQQIVRSGMGLEGRDDRAFLIGLAFGGSLMGLGGAFFDPRFILVDLLALAVVLVVLRVRHSRASAKT